MPVVLVDASALVALLDRSDAHHRPCLETLDELTEPLLTVLPALTEAAHLLSDSPRAVDAISDMVDDDAIDVAPIEAPDLKRMKALMRKYRDLPMDFTDAALVRVAEREKINRILSFDAHFEVYALPSRMRFVRLPRTKSL